MNPHGTYLRYASRHDPCRCMPCRGANAEYHRVYRARSDKPRQAVVRYQRLHRKQRAVAARASS